MTTSFRALFVDGAKIHIVRPRTPFDPLRGERFPPDL